MSNPPAKHDTAALLAQPTPMIDPNWKPDEAEYQAAFRALQEILAWCETTQGDNWQVKTLRQHIGKIARGALPK